MSQPTAETWRVKETIKETDEVTSLVLEGPTEAAAGRKPAQFATLRVMGPEGWSAPHPFTISCEPESPTLRFTIKNVGDFTAMVRDLKPGTPVMCQGPFGAFCKDIDAKENIALIAGGVGVTPFLSVLRHFKATGATNRTVLFWANKTLADAFAREELAELTMALDLTVAHVLSREEPPASPPSGPVRERGVYYERGRLNKDIIAKYAPSSPTTAYYLCGPPAMQETVLAELASCGVGKEAVQTEAFTFKGR